MTDKIPTKSITCLALVKPRSGLHYAWKLDKPGYGIYEYDSAFGTRELRWGDGSSHRLSDAEHDDLILFPQFDEKQVAALFNC
jgi:hypothetical protein